MSQDEKPRVIATVVLAGQEFEIARNGEYALVVVDGEDYYGKPIAARVVPGSLTKDHVQALIDCLGEALEKLKAFEDARKRNMGAEP